MAVHGVDMPLAMEGQDYVWRELWREQGLSEAQLAQHFSGPAFLPWQRMGNIEGYRAPLPQGWRRLTRPAFRCSNGGRWLRRPPPLLLPLPQRPHLPIHHRPSAPSPLV